MNIINYDTEHIQDEASLPMRPMKPHHPAAILSSPDDVLRLAQSYFHLKLQHRHPDTDELQPIPPTPAGLAAHLGFASRAQMMSSIENTAYAEESRSIIAFALTQIEEYIMENALTDRLNVPMSKFALSATLNVIEKKEINTNEDKTVRYVISTGDAEDNEEEEEISRLEALLEEQSKNELLVSGRAEAMANIDRSAEEELNERRPSLSLEDI